MARIPGRSGPTALATTSSTIKTAGTDTARWTIVRSIVLCNTDTVARTATVGIGQNNTDGQAKRIVSGFSLQPGDTVEVLAPGFLPLAHHATTPDLIYAFASQANVVTISIGFVEGP